MKNTICSRFVLGSFIVIVSLSVAQAQTTFFNDTFNNGSTVDSATPVPPTANSSSYETISSKGWNPTSAVAANDLSFGIASTTSGTTEIQALFGADALPLTAAGTDYFQLVIVFTDTSGPLTAGQGFLGFGLYNTDNTSSQTNFPVPSGLNGTATSSSATAITGNAVLWQGYMAQVGYTGNSSAIVTRPVQNQGTLANNAQDLVTTGSGSESYKYPAGSTISPANTTGVTLTTGATYTEVLTIALDANTNLDITNSLYSGTTTNGTLLIQFGGVATNGTSTSLTSGFNALAMGFYQKAGGPTNRIDIASITVQGFSTAVSGPPSITQQPAPAQVTTNGSCAFSITAQGFDVSYQWCRNGTNLVNGGNISGATSSQLVISPATTTDQLTGPNNGYFCVVSGAGGFSADSVTNTLTLITSTNLIWWDYGSAVWDINNTASWQDTNGNQSVFNYGDPVTFNGANGPDYVTLTGNYLSAASVTVRGSSYFVFQGNGSIAGPGPLNYIGSGRLTMFAGNTYTGGTVISNSSAYVLLENYNGLGTGPVTLGEAGGQMEIVPNGSASSGIPGGIIVNDNFDILLDNLGSFGGVFLGDLSGTTGKTLSFDLGPGNPGTNTTRIRLYGNNTVCDANLNLDNSEILLASYASANSQTYNGVISGPGAFMEKGTITYLNGTNTYSGGTTPAQGSMGLGVNSVGTAPITSGPLGTGPLFLAPDSTTTLTGSGEIFASGSAITIANPIEYPSGTNNLTLEIGGSTNLTLAGAWTFQGNDGIVTNTITSRTINVTNTALTIITGVIGDGGNNYGFNVTGSGGVLALNNTETYTGPTTNSGCTLLVNGQVGPGVVILTTNSYLGGTGTISGAVTIQSTSGLKPGNQLTAGVQGIGNLAISSSLTILGNTTNSFVVSATAGTNDLVTTPSVVYAGTLYATNISGTPTVGENFKIFSAGSESGSFTNIIGSPGPGLNWQFTPASGVLSVVQGVAANPTNITYSVSSGNLNLSWPADHLGWILQVQTNSLAHGIGTNWVTVPNSTGVDSTNIGINTTNGAVFYRLVY